MMEQDMEDLAITMVRLLKEDHEVQATVLSLVRSCPNIVVKY